jgi:hypothetical protein
MHCRTLDQKQSDLASDHFPKQFLAISSRSEAGQQPAADTAAGVPSLEGVETEDLVKKERHESSEPGNYSPR